MRIAKYISNSGLCSRRDAEKLILNNKVHINNVLCKKPNINVDIKDKITVNNKVVKLEKKIRLWLLNKPPKVLCTNKDSKKRKTIFDLLPDNFPRVISIGRLDYMSEGLILLTNNGDFARKMELPSSNILRVYSINIRGKIDKEIIKKINNGVKIDGIIYNKIKVRLEKFYLGKSCIIFELKEGKNREIRKICKYFKLNIIKLVRIQFGPYKLKNTILSEEKEIKFI